MKVFGAILTTTATECRLVYKNMFDINVKVFSRIRCVCVRKPLHFITIIIRVSKLFEKELIEKSGERSTEDRVPSEYGRSSAFEQNSVSTSLGSGLSQSADTNYLF